ncbi:MAG: SAM-dependent methyltransferase, partial [Oscillospiraceae bacterium]
MAGKLFVVGTPIGNLSDMTFRGVETLKFVDFVAAEDTRVSVKILNHFDIKKPLLSYHEHSTKYVSDGIVERISNGENCAVVTDAGMPCISDPGEDLVRACVEKGIEIVVV